MPPPCFWRTPLVWLRLAPGRRAWPCGTLCNTAPPTASNLPIRVGHCVRHQPVCSAAGAGLAFLVCCCRRIWDWSPTALVAARDADLRRFVVEDGPASTIRASRISAGSSKAIKSRRSRPSSVPGHRAGDLKHSHKNTLLWLVSRPCRGLRDRLRIGSQPRKLTKQ